MATINEFIYNHAPFSGGNKCDWGFTLSSNFPVADIAEISMQVRDSAGRMLIPEKLLTTGGITLAGYDVEMEFTAAEMKNKPGIHTYGLDFIGADGQPFATISGKFPILAEINKR
jgi:hypothetical protein